MSGLKMNIKILIKVLTGALLLLSLSIASAEQVIMQTGQKSGVIATKTDCTALEFTPIYDNAAFADSTPMTLSAVRVKHNWPAMNDVQKANCKIAQDYAKTLIVYVTKFNKLAKDGLGTSPVYKTTSSTVIGRVSPDTVCGATTNYLNYRIVTATNGKVGRARCHLK